MLDIARLIATRGVVVTILLFPKIGNRVKRVIDRAIDSGLNIRVVHPKLPLAEAGLSQDWDHNFDMLPSFDHVMKLFHAISMLNHQVEKLLQKLEPSPTCLIADMCYPWATHVALKLHIPRIVFHGTSCFSLICLNLLSTSEKIGSLTSNTEFFQIPDTPDKIEINKAPMIGTSDEISAPQWGKLLGEMHAAEEKAFGTVVNTFEELEPEYVKRYIKAKGKKAWCIGPVSLCNKDDLDKAERGGSKASIDDHRFLKWLDSQEPSSVIYVCLGTLSRVSTSQLMELGLVCTRVHRTFIVHFKSVQFVMLKSTI